MFLRGQDHSEPSFRVTDPAKRLVLFPLSPPPRSIFLHQQPVFHVYAPRSQAMGFAAGPGRAAGW